MDLRPVDRSKRVENPKKMNFLNHEIPSFRFPSPPGTVAGSQEPLPRRPRSLH
ncbi:hypothetical protein BDV32DRAFT_131528 [Aspergillus pseudonomiae]|nr:hypothetical protein BDV32DRAFT_131528 [Aspergillus pseudonomiae]